LKSNFLEFLRDALDFCVFVLEADERIRQLHERAHALRTEADAEVTRLENFVLAVETAIEAAPRGASNSPTAQCASRLAAYSAETLHASVQGVRAQLAADVAAAEAQEAAERKACTKALEALLLPHDPPDASTVTRIELAPSGDYSATTAGKAAFGLDWQFEIAVGDTSFWSAPLRVERLLPQLEICTPQLSGWLSKEVKIRPQKLERQIVTELVDSGSDVKIKLRAEPGVDTGFDIDVAFDTGRIEMTRVGGKDEAAAAAFEVRAEDVPKLIELAGKLHASVQELKRTRLVSATMGGDSFEAQATFIAMVERVVSMLAPMTAQITEHSLTPTELVIRRLLANDRREEIFVTKASLYEKYTPLPDRLRSLFAPLGLDATQEHARGSLTPAAEASLERSELPRSQPPPPPPRFPGAVSDAVAVPPPAAVPDVGPNPDAGKERNEALVAALKKIVGLAKVGSSDEAYREYSVLFSSSAFAKYRPEDQRQALRLMILKKTPPASSDAVLDAHRAAALRLQDLLDKQDDPIDYELLGVTQLVLHNTAAASATFATGLALERRRNPQSELCESLTKRVASTWES